MYKGRIKRKKDINTQQTKWRISQQLGRQSLTEIQWDGLLFFALPCIRKELPVAGPAGAWSQEANCYEV